MMLPILFRAILCTVAVASIWLPARSSAEDPSPVLSDGVSRLMGIYQAMPPDARVSGLPFAKAVGRPSLHLTAQAQGALNKEKTLDPKDLCQVLGPFRMMAQPQLKFEILRDAPNKLVLLFQQSSWGHVRTISIGSRHLQDYSKVRPMWNGDSIATWDKDTLVIDTIHFTDKTWLNEAGVTNSKQLHLTERLRLVKGGRYLEYEAIAVDPEVLAQPATYTRYFVRSAQEITEDNCFARRAAILAVKQP